MSVEDIQLRKGFSAVRLDGGGVRIRVRTGEQARWVAEAQMAPPYPEDGKIPTDDPRWEMLPTYRSVELSAAEWIDLIAAVSVGGLERFDRAVDLHMGPAEGA